MRYGFCLLALATTGCHLIFPLHSSPGTADGAGDARTDRASGEGPRGDGQRVEGAQRVDGARPAEGGDTRREAGLDGGVTAKESGTPPPGCGKLFTTAGWCWENPLPHGATLHGAWSDGTTHVVVGAKGMVVRHTAGKSEQLVPPTLEHLYAVSGSSASDLWIAGAAGTVLHFDGAGLTPHKVPASVDLRGVFAADPSKTFVVGGQGTILERNGPSWKVSQPTSVPLSAVHGAGPSRLFAVGVNETILGYDGTQWQSLRSSAGGNQLLAVHDDGLAVIAGGNNTLLSSSDGVIWDARSLPTGVSSIRGLGRRGQDLIVAGDAASGGRLVRWDGKAWSDETPSSSLPSLWTLARAGSLAAGASGLVLEHTSGGWSRLGAGAQSTIYGLGGSGADDLHAVGNKLLLHWDGSAWAEQSLPVATDLYAVAARSKSEAYAVGTGGNALRWNGSTWSALPKAPFAPTLRSIWVPPAPAQGFYAASASALLRYDGTAWQALHTPTTPGATLKGLFGVGGKLFAVGTNVALERDLAGMVSEVNLTPHDLRAVWGAAPDDVHAVGYNVVFRYDGTSWKQDTKAPKEILHAIAGSSATNIYAAGVSGAILRFDGNAWTQVSSPTAAELQAVWTDGSTVRVAGLGGLLLRLP